ncbi:DUF805 domain-containing protein [Cyanobium sp. LEGE 06143]|jgi:uncharacterized membrane protein YhaH (DUF805 family)|uniref:DUF805 domain-containing protein n=1 Tax=unclassified Cyanobium TaxID=2627006 RepID=UPI00187FFE66|nr:MULTISPECIES: DUF805 domain-containing protein [unclassified Cyanobium]MBE9153575.1 DUF805 domain-containing protein [Cyanobium sp. LEGE 06113]MBE9172274.1 DUF805 domain-containing protein [Cyanobium sp. LEGE 06143]
MRLIEAFTSAWSRSFDYSGRSNRGDYWWFVLANLIVGIVLQVVSEKLYWVYAIASLVPGIPICVRRLRDIGKPWPWLLLSLIPIVGAIWLIVLFCQPSVAL